MNDSDGDDAPDRQAARGSAGQAGREREGQWCPGCGTGLEARSCKLRCPRCGYFEDCSNLL